MSIQRAGLTGTVGLGGVVEKQARPCRAGGGEMSERMSEEKFERCVRGEAFRMIVAEARRARESEEAWIKDATALSDARDRNHAEIEKRGLLSDASSQGR